MNSLGREFIITVYGESHGRCVGVVIDGCPSGLPLTAADVQADIDRRRPGTGPAFTTRHEENRVEILSGVLNDRTTGAPLNLIIWNNEFDNSDYERIAMTPRPGHADYAAHMKYGGFADRYGGGMFSGRMTAAGVMAGAVARKLLAGVGIEIAGHTVEIGGIAAAPAAFSSVKTIAGKDTLRCADPAASIKMNELIAAARSEGDSLGGIIEGIAVGLPVGLGEPFFDTLEGDLAKALFSIPAVKGVEFGAGFNAARMKGSEHNDGFTLKEGQIITLSGNAGGILGGISNGMPLVVRVAVKPTPSISKEQQTVDLRERKDTVITVKGRHDACIVPRAVAAVEAMMAVILADFAVRAGIIPKVL